MKRIAICDTDQAFALALASNVQSYFHGNCQVSCFRSSAELRLSGKTHPIDIVIIDTNFDQGGGIALAKELFSAHSGTAVIFVADNMECCTEVYETEHIYLLIKPLQTEQLHKALKKAIDLTQNTVLFFPVQVNGKIIRVNLDEIIYIESFYRKIRIHTQDETIEAYGTFASLPIRILEKLIHCHKSFLVNPAHIKSMSSDHFLLVTNDTIPISHNSKSESKHLFLTYLSSRLADHSHQTI